MAVVEEVDIPGPWYYYWLIPSVFSAIMTMIMLLHIGYSWKSDHNLFRYQKICLLFGFFDLIQDIGLIMDLYERYCRIQYTLFLSGSLYKSFVATGGLGGLYVMIIHNYIPSNIDLMKWGILWSSIATAALLVLFISDVYQDLGCSKNSRENLIAVDHVTIKSQVIFAFTYCFFTLLCCLLVTFMSLRILYRFRSYSHFYTFRTTVVLYIFIFLFAIVPGCVYLLNLAISHEYHDTILEITGLSLCSSGWLYSLTYFFLNYSPKIKKFIEKLSFPTKENHQILMSSQSSSIPNETIGIKKKKSSHPLKTTGGVLGQSILSHYHDESHWTESETDPYELSFPDSSPDITHHDHIPNPINSLSIHQEEKENFHNKLISSLLVDDIRVEKHQEN